MAPPKKQPLETSTAANILPETRKIIDPKTGKTVEEMYQKKTQLEHILLRPDTYIGSIEKHAQELWVYNSDSQMVCKTISYVPGLYKIFDEILVNAADNKQRDFKMDRIEVTISQEDNTISVFNTGDGIPVEIHKEEGVYVPELIFGHLLTSSNYNDDEKKTTGGRNGYGAKLANIFSTEFIIETADGKRQLKYKQVFTNNMSNKGTPVTHKCKSTDNWTKITFKPDLSKFKMTELEDDVVALMKKRVVDLAGCLAASPGKKVKVLLNGTEIDVKSFHEYAQLYLDSANQSKEEEQHLPRIDNNLKEDFNPRWQISVTRSEGQFQQVSFVNSINTIKGGTHVDYITGQITKFIIEQITKMKKRKTTLLKPHIVKNHLWVFVNALIDNPAFDSQTKETLTTKSANFGTTCDLSYKFLKKVVDNSGVVQSVISWVDYKADKDLKKTDGSKTRKIYDIPKLDDASEAGGRRSHECTLILTEGDSAKALAMAGISVVGRSLYGVFPLRGKLLNVREASAKQISENQEINNIKKILGLKQGENYDKDGSIKQLRYGHLMIMADQDHDGSHIKGLLINFIHTFWPSLLRNPTFMLEFITPIVKASHNDKKDVVLSFYSMPEYEDWVKEQGTNLKKWTVKYYKGLGTSDSNEGKQYFTNLQKHRKVFVWSDDKDGEAIELAFSKKKIEARKDWLREEESGSVLDHKEEKIKYSDFVHKELKLFSRADLQRSIPSVVDGLKPTQRKVLFAAFKRNLVNQIKVVQFAGYVSEKSSYHHGEQSIQTTIVGMAQNFVGTNNVNLLLPKGQFGTRNMGGKDAASARYIHTQLAPVTRFLFPKEDDALLSYLKEDGLSIEPVWYMPIIPMVLVNGSEGIGTGWSTFIPNYNPREIIANIRRLLKDEPLQPMDPWYHKFQGTIQKSAVKESGVTYTVTGTIEEIDESDDGDNDDDDLDDGQYVKLKITELPIRKWTEEYKAFLESMEKPVDRSKEPFLKRVINQSTNEIAQFKVILTEANYKLAKQEGLLKKFKLTSTLSTSNMHLFDEDNKITRYESPEQILELFYPMRLKYYQMRKQRYLEIYGAELVKLSNQVRFILGVVEGEIVVCKRKKAELVNELRVKGFTPIPKVKPVESIVAGATEEGAEEPEEVEDTSGHAAAASESLSDFDYLLSMSISSLTVEKVRDLLAKKDGVNNQIEQLKRETDKSLWAKDLDGLEKALEEKERVEEEELQESLKKMEGDGEGEGDKPANKPRKINRKTTKPKPKSEPSNSSVGIDMDTENPPQKQKAKPKAAPKKAAAAAKKGKSTDVGEEEDEYLPLRERLAAYHLDSSPEISAAMETDAPSKAAGKSSLDIVQEISDDEVASPEPVKKGRGRGGGGKAKAAPKQPAAAATKKRAPAAKQKLITDAFKSSETLEASPDKKVRKMRPSPFNKKSGSVLNRGQDGESASSSLNTNLMDSGLDSIEEVMPARPRPKRANRKQTTYILSDTEPEDDDPYEDDDASVSEFEEDDD